MYCPNCNTGLSGTPKFCPKCGAKIEAMTTEPPATKKCPQCGSENALAAKFCKTDGYRFDSATPTTAISAAVPRQEASPTVLPAVASEPPATKKCPQCGTENAFGAKFCKTDGYRFDGSPPASAAPVAAPRQEASPTLLPAVASEPPATKKCPQCGTENAPGAKFCKTDGYRFDGSPPASAAPAAAPRQEASSSALPAVASEPPATKKCPQCGSENTLAAKFCKVDGYRFDSAIPTPTVRESAPRQEPPPSAVATATPDSSDSVTSQPGEEPAEPELPPISPPPVPPAADIVICPKCGTANAASAKFCKKDGVALSAASNVGRATAAAEKANVARVEGRPSPSPIPVTEPPPVPVRQATAPIPQAKSASSKSYVAIATGIVAVLLAAGGGGYWYLAGRTPPTSEAIESAPTTPASSASSTPTQVQSTPTRQTVDAAVTMILADAGFSKTIQSTTDADLVVTLYGSVSNEEQRASVLTLVKSATGVAAVNDQLTVAQAAPLAPPAPDDVPIAQAAPPTPSFDATGVQQDINRQLRNRGLSGVSVKVNADRSAVLRGKVNTAKEKEDAQILVSNSPELSGVRNTIQIVAEPPQTVAAVDPAKLEGEINRALRNGGVGSVTAQVADDLSVTLKGSVTSAEQKDRAFQVARRFQARGMPKDRIFVVEQ